MRREQGFRIPWVALIFPALIFPLYGQSSCDPCPPAVNPCQQAAGRTVDTNECVYTNADGSVCDFQGSDGICYQGDCVRADCKDDVGYSTCIEPLSGGFEGTCIDDVCVTAAPVDLCVNVGVGRINCCSQQGCADADGVICADPLDGVSCDPAGLTPPNTPPQNGICVVGTCVAQTGQCADMVCAVDPEIPCARNDCDPATGQCELFPVAPFLTCGQSEGVDASCNGGVCTPDNLPGICGTSCADGSDCTYDLCISLTLTNSGPWECQNPLKPAGSSCDDGQGPGQCDPAGTCQPTFTSECDHEVNDPDRNDPDCDDGNECTYNRCDFFDQCINPLKPVGSSCDDGQGQCLFGTCQPTITP